MKLLTVTVPCYNSAAYMDKCINTLLVGGDRVEIIIINDGSKDNTGEIADKYAAEYPNIVKVVHQENGGHGEGINQGIKHATGKYFKVVDSDDWLDVDGFPAMLDFLENNDVDMLVYNFLYAHDNKKLDSTIRFKNIFPVGKIISFEETKPFKVHQCLTIHTCTFRTDILKESKVELPKHMFYEDNLFVFTPLPYVKKLAYLDIDLYYYYIGREDQSVNEQIIMKRYVQQLNASRLLACTHDVLAIKEQRKVLGKYMIHELEMLLLIASIFARLNKTQEADENLQDMWDQIIAHNEKQGKLLRYHTLAKWFNVKGKFGRWLCISIYRFARIFVKFN